MGLKESLNLLADYFDQVSLMRLCQFLISYEPYFISIVLSFKTH